MYRTAYNPTPSPVVVDDEGRMIGGREWGTYDTTEPVATAALGRGDLIEVKDPDGDVPAGTALGALDAFAHTRSIRERQIATADLDKDTLRQVAVDADLILPTDEPGVAALREAVTEHTDVTIPQPEPAPKRTARK